MGFLNTIRIFKWDHSCKVLPYLCELCLIAKEEECTNTILGIVIVVVHDEAVPEWNISTKTWQERE